MPKLGTIIALPESPSTTEFSFVMDKTGEVRKGQYIQTESKGRIIVGYVAEITRANRYFERAESVAGFEQQGGMQDHFPVDEWEYGLSHVKIAGAFEKGRLQRVYAPPRPGADVVAADETLLKKLLAFEPDGLHLGRLQHHEIEARLSLTKLLQKHLAILAMSGAGKSHLASILLEELLDRTPEQGRISVIVVDIHGEYAGFANDEHYGAKTRLIEGNKISIPLRKISPEQMAEWMPYISHPQRELLHGTITQLRREKGAHGYGFKELLAAIEANGSAKDEVKRTLRRALGELRRYRFLSTGKENPKLQQELHPGELLILDLSDIDSLRKKQILVSLIARRLFKLRKKNRIPPFLLMVEEAHNFAPEKAETYEAPAKAVIETLAREGRKFGASLALISQRPVNLSTTALSQCNTHIILRITNPNDLDHVQKSSEGIDARVVRNITGLQVGEAIIVGEAVRYPTFVNIRDRKSVKRERGLPLHEQAKQFEEMRAKKEKQVEAFL